MGKFKWQGETVKVEFGQCRVVENKENPLYWYNYNVANSNSGAYALISAIKITTKCGQEFCILNENGYGLHKLRNGGWPNYGHASLPLGTFETIEPLPWKMKLTLENEKFNLEGYEELESKRRNWQKKNFPKEFEESEKLLQSIRARRNNISILSK